MQSAGLDISDQPESLYKFGGVSLVVSGVLFLSTHALSLLAGPPPASGEAILAWVAANKSLLAVANEILFFALMFLIPGLLALHRSLARVERTKAAIGCSMIAALIPTLIVLEIVHGRLVFPVYGLQISNPAVAELVVAIFYGGLHAVDEVFGLATIVLGLAMRRGGYGSGIAYLGIVTGVFDFVASYPWLLGPIPILLCRVLFAAWFVAVGARLFMAGRTRPRREDATARTAARSRASP